MLRLSRQSDLAIQLLAEVARRKGFTPAGNESPASPNGDSPAAAPISSRELAESVRAALPMTSKVLKALQRGSLLESTRGKTGGYRLARPAQSISVATVIEAVDGPIALTPCADGATGCEVESWCHVAGHLQAISNVINDALHSLTLDELAIPKPSRRDAGRKAPPNHVRDGDPAPATSP